MNSLVKEDPVLSLDTLSLLSKGYASRSQVDNVSGPANKANSLGSHAPTTKQHVLSERSPMVVESTQMIQDYGSFEPTVPEPEVEGYASPLLASLLGSPLMLHGGAVRSPEVASIKTKAEALCDPYTTIKKEVNDSDLDTYSPGQRKTTPLVDDNPECQSSMETKLEAQSDSNSHAVHSTSSCDTCMSDPLLAESANQEGPNIPRPLPFEQYPCQQAPPYIRPFERQCTENYDSSRDYEQTLALERRIALAWNLGRIYERLSFGQRAPDDRFFDPLVGTTVARPLSKSLHGVPLQSASHTGGQHLAFNPPCFGSFHPGFDYGCQDAQNTGYAQGDQNFLGSTGSGAETTSALDTDFPKNVRLLQALIHSGHLNASHLISAASFVANTWCLSPPLDLSPPYPIATGSSSQGSSSNLHPPIFAPFALLQSQLSHQVSFPDFTLTTALDRGTFGLGVNDAPNPGIDQPPPPDDLIGTDAQDATPPQTYGSPTNDTSPTQSLSAFTPVNPSHSTKKRSVATMKLDGGQKECPIPGCKKRFSRPCSLKDHMSSHGWAKRKRPRIIN